MIRKKFILLVLFCLSLSACSKPVSPYIGESKSKIIEARLGQDYAEYALYNPIMSAEMGIEIDDIEYAIGTFRLLNPTIDKLESLTELDYITLYYNQYGQVIIEIKEK